MSKLPDKKEMLQKEKNKGGKEECMNVPGRGLLLAGWIKQRKNKFQPNGVTQEQKQQ